MQQDWNAPDWSNAIFSLRQRLELSQSEFGSRLNYSAMAVSRWETGKQEPTSRCFIHLGNIAGQPECWFFWARAGLKSFDLGEMLPGTRTHARRYPLALKLYTRESEGTGRGPREHPNCKC